MVNNQVYLQGVVRNTYITPVKELDKALLYITLVVDENWFDVVHPIKLGDEPDIYEGDTVEVDGRLHVYKNMNSGIRKVEVHASRLHRLIKGSE